MLSWFSSQRLFSRCVYLSLFIFCLLLCLFLGGSFTPYSGTLFWHWIKSLISHPVTHKSHILMMITSACLFDQQDKIDAKKKICLLTFVQVNGRRRKNSGTYISIAHTGGFQLVVTNPPTSFNLEAPVFIKTASSPVQS